MVKTSQLNLPLKSERRSLHLIDLKPFPSFTRTCVENLRETSLCNNQVWRLFKIQNKINKQTKKKKVREINSAPVDDQGQQVEALSQHYKQPLPHALIPIQKEYHSIIHNKISFIPYKTLQ